jgi:hypothetical protein
MADRPSMRMHLDPSEYPTGGVERATLTETHVFAGTIEADDLNDMWHVAQCHDSLDFADAAKRAEALSASLRALCERGFSAHMAMSVGDVALDLTHDVAYIVKPFGFETI